MLRLNLIVPAALLSPARGGHRFAFCTLLLRLPSISKVHAHRSVCLLGPVFLEFLQTLPGVLPTGGPPMVVGRKREIKNQRRGSFPAQLQ